MRLPSELRNFAMARMGKNGKEEKVMEEGGVKKRGQTYAVPFLFCDVKALPLTWITAVFSCLLPKICSPHSSLIII